ncbi:hypothetical protein NBRC116188_19280 [Oceaniserpentilla sp. 4NH20-0058]|uniref:hypothetical protein n=1 Tax=Oceaniserpentilla sp. 4NH20-0058 TaxID=3127660 RepID=UPI003107A6C3
MDKKISLDLAKQHYYIHIPSAQGQKMFSSVFAYDALLSSLNALTNISVYGYCLLPSHIHLLVYSETKPSIWLEPWLMAYNQWHQNTTLETVYLFNDEQIRSVLIQPKYLCKTLRHIHYLPVQNKRCSAPDQYLYSSYKNYMNDQSTGVDTDPILSMLSPHYGQRIRRFSDYMAVNNQKPSETFNEGNHPFYRAYADNAYLTQVRAKYQETLGSASEEEHLKTWHGCLHKLIEINGLDEETWLGKHRHHSQPDAHFILAWLFVTVANGPTYIAAKQLRTDEATLKLKINSIHLHHPAKYLRYIEHSWNPIAV